MGNQKTMSCNVDGKLKKLKVEGIKNVSFLSFPSARTVDTFLYVDGSMVKVKTVVNINGSLEIFIEKSLD